MANMDDMDLVREYAAGRSDQVFATIVSRHINLVYSAALRQTGDFQQAEEVTQAVFLILARKAGSLHPDTVLSGWLYKTAQFTAANARRAAIRQHHREQEAQMQFMRNSETDETWRQLAPVLEEAMASLGGKERDAIVLRYFENRTVGEVAAALRVNPAAAQKRVDRGTEKLRRHFVKRGVPISAAVLGTAIGANAVQAAPAILVPTVIAKGVAGTSALALTNTTLKLMTGAQAKMTTLIVAATFGATAVATVGIGSLGSPLRSPYQFEGEGFIRMKNILPHGATNYFKVIVRDGQWRIITQRANEKPDFTEVGFDGNELIRVVHFDNYQKQELQKGGVLGKTTGANIATADVQYFPVPYMLVDSGTLPVWFAYASSAYLDKSTPGRLAPLNLDVDTSKYEMVLLGYEEKAEVQRRRSPPGLPERAVFFDNGWRSSRRGMVLRDPPYDNGFTNTVFQALAFTNLAGMEIPTHFTMSCYGPKRDGTNADDLFRSAEADVQLTNLSSRIPITHFKPDCPKGVVFFGDRRFAGGTPYARVVDFFATNSGWLTTEQVKKLPAYKQRMNEPFTFGPFHTQDGALLDTQGKPVDLRHYPPYRPLNFPHSLRIHDYPNPFLLASFLTVAILVSVFLVQRLVRILR